MRFSVAGIGAAARLLPERAALAAALSMRLAPDQRPPDMVILLADTSLASRADAAALLRAARHVRQQGAGFIVALLVHPAATPAHAGIGLPALAEQCDCLIELPRTPEAPMQCVESLIRPMASDATMIMGLETVRDALQSPGLIRFGCASAIGPVETRSHRATLAALRQARQGATDDYRGDAFLFVKGKRRTLERSRDCLNVLTPAEN